MTSPDTKLSGLSGREVDPLRGIPLQTPSVVAACRKCRFRHLHTLWQCAIGAVLVPVRKAMTTAGPRSVADLLLDVPTFPTFSTKPLIVQDVFVSSWQIRKPTTTDSSDIGAIWPRRLEDTRFDLRQFGAARWHLALRPTGQTRIDPLVGRGRRIR